MATTTARTHHAVTSSTAAHVIDKRTESRSVDAGLAEDPGEHRKSGDRHGCAHEQREAREAAASEQRVEDSARATRGRTAATIDTWLIRTAGAGNRASLVVELQADEEHEEDQPELGHDPAGRSIDLRREEVLGDLGRDRADQARAEEDPGDDLAHHPRLAEPSEHESHHAGGGDHDGDSKECAGDDLAGLQATLGLDPVRRRHRADDRQCRGAHVGDMQDTA